MFVGVGIDGAAVALFRGHLQTNAAGPDVFCSNLFVLLLFEAAAAIAFVGIGILLGRSLHFANQCDNQWRHCRGQ